MLGTLYTWTPYAYTLLTPLTPTPPHAYTPHTYTSSCLTPTPLTHPVSLGLHFLLPARRQVTVCPGKAVEQGHQFGGVLVLDEEGVVIAYGLNELQYREVLEERLMSHFLWNIEMFT